MLVGEAPGAEEERTGLPFVGAAGNELDRMLAEVGIPRAECFVTNVSRLRPPGNDISEWIYHGKKAPPTSFIEWRGKWVNPAIAVGAVLLTKEIAAVKPALIIPLGNVAMYALTSRWGITDWRGSQLSYDADRSIAVIPTIHPAAILRQWSWRAAVIADLRRAARVLKSPTEAIAKPYYFTLRPSFAQVMSKLSLLLTDLAQGEKILSFDIETRHGHIDCCAIAWSEYEALCIPFIEYAKLDPYWSLDEEMAVIDALRRVLTHSNARCVGQNLLYDAQYTTRWWHFTPRVWQDTMISHHTAFCELPKKLDFQASLYCAHYVQWKTRVIQKTKEGG
jgi:DNA polymerase